MRKVLSYSVGLALFISLYLLPVSCQSQPDYLIEEEKMTELLTDVHMSEGLIDLQSKVNKNDPEYGKQVMASVLKKYNVSKADYDSSLVWYSQHLNTFIRIYKHVNKNLSERQDYWSELAASVDAFGSSPSGDSVNLWRQDPYLLMDEARLSLSRVWRFSADTAYHAGDTIRWQMHFPDLPGGEVLVASLALLSPEDGTGGRVLLDGATTPMLSRDTLVTLICAADPDKEISQVIAALHLMKMDSVSLAMRPCVVDSLQMIRLHRK